MGELEGRKRPSMEMEMEDQNEQKKANLDLNLTLSLPGSHQKGDEPSNMPSNDACTLPSSSSTQPSCTSSVTLDTSTNYVELLGSGGPEIPSLILMGCARCLMYTMVSQADPKCPKCQSSALIDVFRRKPNGKEG
ncbi:hypothetical protein SLE2022_111590 [Rubroshorea leprosula]